MTLKNVNLDLCASNITCGKARQESLNGLDSTADLSYSPTAFETDRACLLQCLQVMKLF